MLFLVATNVIASRPPERRPTGTPHARANIIEHLDQKKIWLIFLLQFSWQNFFPPNFVSQEHLFLALIFLAQNFQDNLG